MGKHVVCVSDSKLLFSCPIDLYENIFQNVTYSQHRFALLLGCCWVWESTGCIVAVNPPWKPLQCSHVAVLTMKAEMLSLLSLSTRVNLVLLFCDGDVNVAFHLCLVINCLVFMSKA